MSKMLKRIPAELMVASSLLLAPSLTLMGYGQNNQPAARRHRAPRPVAPSPVVRPQ